MRDLEEIRRRLQGHTLVRSLDQVPRGHVRIETPFLYPDGASIDVFVVNDTPLLGPSKLSDLGQTVAWLADVQVKPWMSKKRQRFLEDALRLYGVRQDGGALEWAFSSLDSLVDGIVLLGQACVRVADLAYTTRNSMQSTFVEQVEEVIVDTGVSYEPDVELEGRYGNVIKVEFLVSGRHRKTAVLTMSSGNSSQAHAQANEIFRKWHDLEIPTRLEQRVTVFDDSVDVYRTDDIQRLKEHSDVVALSEKQTLQDLLAA